MSQGASPISLDARRIERYKVRRPSRTIVRIDTIEDHWAGTVQVGILSCGHPSCKSEPAVGMKHGCIECQCEQAKALEDAERAGR